MADLVEVINWENGVYQLETTDPVEGGPGGIDNRQAQQLANRTAYLKQQADRRAAASAAIIAAAGLTLNEANNAQLLEAIERLIDAQSGNYALDTGLANAYVVALDPAVAVYGDGMTVRFKVTNANTGASTLNAGGGVVPLVNDVGGALAAGDLPAGSVIEATYIASADKFHITSMVQSQGDARYAKLGQIVGKNKLLNTNFENPVNQLGKATRVTTPGAYNFDCWYSGLDLKFYQAADYFNLSASQQYTLNWEGTATAEYLISPARSATIEAQGGWTAIAKGAQLTTPADLISGAKFVWIRWTGVTSSLATFDKPQLEEGTVATVHENKYFRTRLLECQVYLPGLSADAGGTICEGYMNTAVEFRAIFQFKVQSRWPVTGLIYSGTFGTLLPNNDAPPVDLGGVTDTTTVYSAHIFCPSPVRTVGFPGVLRFGVAGSLYFSGAQI